MSKAIEIDSPAGVLTLRPERDDDKEFRYRLFCDSRQPEFALLLAPPIYQQVMAHQFQAQTVSYQTQFPHARFDIIELAGEPIGRLVVDRPGPMLHLIDQAIVSAQRNRGIGTAIMRALMAEAGAANIPVRLEVSSQNDPSMCLYARLGFVPVGHLHTYIEMEWPASAGSGEERRAL